MFELDQWMDETVLVGVQHDLAQCGVPVREDLIEAHAAVLSRIARPGAWWTGAQRVAMVAATRSARDCPLCEQRREALSPHAIQGAHQLAPSHADVLPAELVDIIHFATTDAVRMTQADIDDLAAAGLSDAHYVEALGVAVAVRSRDQTCRGLGAPLHELPAPVDGEPSRVQPGAEPAGQACVPMLAVAQPPPPNDDLWDDNSNFYGLRALSLVPDAVRDLRILSAAQYLPLDKAGDCAYRRALGREQVELLAGRVSAINECFY